HRPFRSRARLLGAAPAPGPWPYDLAAARIHAWTEGRKPCDTPIRTRSPDADAPRVVSRSISPRFTALSLQEQPRGVRVKNRGDDRSNTSANRPFADVLSSYRSRRAVLRGGLQSAAAAFFLSSTAASLAATKPRGKARPG